MRSKQRLRSDVRMAHETTPKMETMITFIDEAISLTPVDDAAKMRAIGLICMHAIAVTINPIDHGLRFTYEFVEFDADVDRAIASALSGGHNTKQRVWELEDCQGRKRSVTPLCVDDTPTTIPGRCKRVIDFRIVLTKEEVQRRRKSIEDSYRQHQTGERMHVS